MDRNVIEGVANVLGATDIGLTGTEIGRILAGLGIPVPAPASRSATALRTP